MKLPRIADILTAASRLSGVPVETILHGGRSRQYVHLRAAVAIVARRYATPRMVGRYSYPAIGRALGGLDHSTVVYLVNTADMYAKRDPSFPAFVERLHAAAEGIELFAEDRPEDDPETELREARRRYLKKGHEVVAENRRRLVSEHPSTSRKAGRSFMPRDGEEADGGHTFHARIAEGSKAFAAALAAARNT